MWFIRASVKVRSIACRLRKAGDSDWEGSSLWIRTANEECNYSFISVAQPGLKVRVCRCLRVCYSDYVIRAQTR